MVLVEFSFYFGMSNTYQGDTATMTVVLMCM